MVFRMNCGCLFKLNYEQVGNFGYYVRRNGDIYLYRSLMFMIELHFSRKSQCAAQVARTGEVKTSMQNFGGETI
jgi:hypothetical protein